jgi:hypothetical protein
MWPLQCSASIPPPQALLVWYCDGCLSFGPYHCILHNILPPAQQCSPAPVVLECSGPAPFSNYDTNILLTTQSQKSPLFCGCIDDTPAVIFCHRASGIWGHVSSRYSMVSYQPCCLKLSVPPGPVCNWVLCRPA